MVNQTRTIGIDLSKRSMEVAIIKEGEEKIQRKTFKTTLEGQQKFILSLKKTDVVALETGNASFQLAKQVQKQVGCKVHVLNAGQLHVIFESMKKTDKEDAMNIAKFVARTPEAELPTVNLPSDEELLQRSSVTEQERVSQMRTKSINALHNLFWNQGITDLTKKDFHTAEKRMSNVNRLPEKYHLQAKRLIKQIALYEEQLQEIEKEQTEMLKVNQRQTTITMSMPGIGPKTALALHAYVGDMSRFLYGSQLTFYLGLVPRVDKSGDQNHYGSITKRGPKQVRRVMNQAAWAAIRSKDGEYFARFFLKIKERRGTGRAIVAVSRKMLEILFAMHKNKTLFNPGAAAEIRVQKKMKIYKLI